MCLGLYRAPSDDSTGCEGVDLTEPTIRMAVRTPVAQDNRVYDTWIGYILARSSAVCPECG